MNNALRVSDLLRLDGKTAVVTGAASGIGRAISFRLAEAGARIVLLDIDSARGLEVESALKKNGAVSRFRACDITCEADCRRVTAETVEDFGRLDILCNNAGVIRRADILSLEESEWDRVLGVGLKGIYLLSRQILPYMLKAGRGSIINTGSGWSLKGGPKAAAYCAAKGGVLNLTRAMAIDYGPHGIRVNCICPGDIDTPMLHSEARQLGENEAEFMREAADRPLRRCGSPMDVADAVLFFASDMSRWVTGAHLVVDGGGLA